MEMMERFFGEGKHLNDEGVALYVDALKLDTLDQVPPAIRAHVAHCYDCKKSITGLFALLDDVDYSDVRSHPFLRLSHGTGSRLPLLLKMAAVIAGVAILGTITYFLGSFRQIQSSRESLQGHLGQSADSVQNAQQTSSTSHVASKADYAADFIVDPELEHLVDGRYRSAAMNVESPINGSVTDSDAVFRWKGEARKPVTLCIMNNKGKIILTENVSLSEFVLRQKLSPGLYYWKIESKSELLYVGRFFVK